MGEIDRRLERERKGRRSGSEREKRREEIGDKQTPGRQTEASGRKIKERESDHEKKL